jgi:hypothetical protein
MRACSTVSCLITIVLTSPGMSAAAPAWQLSSCPQPTSPLSQVQTNVDREIPKPMIEDTSKAQLEFASAFAAQTTGGIANWCVRYEIANQGPNSVPLLNWPLVGLKFEELTTADGLQSTLLTLPPSLVPALKDTFLYGFKAQAIKTKAFQSAQAQSNPSLITLVASNEDDSASSGVNDFKQTFALERGDRLPEVGGTFNGAGTDVGAVSIVSRDNDVYHFAFQIGRNSSKSVQSVTAPLALAFAKLQEDVVRSPSALASTLKEVGSSEVGLQNDIYDVRMDVPVTDVPRIYVVFQPISFRGISKSNVCFLVPTYSPVNIPKSFLSCP